MENCNNCDLNRKIFQTKNGSIYYCSGSKKYEIEIVSMLVYFNPKEFEYFCSFIKLLDLSNEDRYVHLPSGKIIIQPALNSGFYAFHLSELFELKELVEGATSLLTMETDISKIFSEIRKKPN